MGRAVWVFGAGVAPRVGAGVGLRARLVVAPGGLPNGGVGGGTVLGFWTRFFLVARPPFGGVVAFRFLISVLEDVLGLRSGA